jgi:phosphatidylserine synthase
VSGASPWTALASITADEADGRIARATGTESEFGSNLDFTIDMTMTGLVAMKLFKSPWPLLLITPAQAYMRSRGYRPKLGSARAVMMLATLAMGRR